MYKRCKRHVEYVRNVVGSLFSTFLLIHLETYFLTNNFTSRTKLAKMTGTKVAFSSVEIIELPYTIGHGPTSGAPVSLGWEVIDRSSFNLDFFEHYRPPRREKPALRLTAQKRRDL